MKTDIAGAQRYVLLAALDRTTGWKEADVAPAIRQVAAALPASAGSSAPYGDIEALRAFLQPTFAAGRVDQGLVVAMERAAVVFDIDTEMVKPLVAGAAASIASAVRERQRTRSDVWNAAIAPDAAKVDSGSHFDEATRRAIMEALQAESSVLTERTGLEHSAVCRAVAQMLAHSLAFSGGKHPPGTSSVLNETMPVKGLTAGDAALTAIQYYCAATQCSLACTYPGSVTPSLAWYYDDLYLSCDIDRHTLEAWFAQTGIGFAGQMAHMGREVSERFRTIRDHMAHGVTLADVLSTIAHDARS